MSVEDALRLAIARDGQIFGLAVFPNKGEWQASIRTKDGGYTVGIDADPVRAVVKAIGPVAADIFG